MTLRLQIIYKHILTWHNLYTHYKIDKFICNHAILYYLISQRKVRKMEAKVIRDWKKLKDEMHRDFSSEYTVITIFVIENTIEIDISKKILVPKDFIFISKMLKKYNLNLLNVSTYRRNFCFSFY